MVNETFKQDLYPLDKPPGYGGDELPDVYFGSNAHIVSSEESESCIELPALGKRSISTEVLQDRDGFNMRFFMTSSGDIIDTDKVVSLANGNHLNFVEQISAGRYVEVNADGTRLSDRPETDQILIDMYLLAKKR